MLMELKRMPFGDKLRELRELAGLSQAALAEKAELSIRSIQNWEQGHRGPSAAAIFSLAKALGVSAEKLLGEVAKGGKPPKKPRGRPKKS
jgi:transcriptional regulator with XRE-family HTH domain